MFVLASIRVNLLMTLQILICISCLSLQNMFLLYNLFFPKKFQREILLEIFLVIILAKNKLHVLQQQNLMSQLLLHKFVDQAV